MIKALRLLLALCFLLPDVAAAKTLIVVPHVTGALAAHQSPINEDMDFQARRITEILDLTGASYTVIPHFIARTEFCRTGAMVWNYGAPGAYVEQFDAVIHVGFLNLSQNTIYNPDSMFKRAKLAEPNGSGSTWAPTVPQLCVGVNAKDGLASTGAYGWSAGAGAASCTTGANNEDGDNPHGALQISAIYAAGGSEYWLNSSNLGGWPMDQDSSRTAGGVRIHLAHSNALYTNLEHRGRIDGVVCSNPDSFSRDDYPAYGDPYGNNAVLWERLMSHVTGAKPGVFVWATGASPCTDSLRVEAGKIPCEGEASVLLAGLARLDSLSGGLVFGPKPIRWALTIDGGFSRSGRRNSGGVFDPDSASLKASIDSLQALNIPAVLGVNIDSVGAYPSEKGWWTRWNKLRYSPQSRLGLDSTVKNLGNSTRLRPVDVWGRWRQRIAYQNNDCSASGDTSVYCGLKAQFYRMDSIPDFTGRVSHFIMAPDDDWTPINKFSGVSPDSVLYAASLAGVSGIRINSQEPPNSAYGSKTNPKGWYGQQGRRTAFGRSVKLLAHSGYSISGSALQINVQSDSVAPITSSTENELAYRPYNIIGQELQRAWNAGLYQRYRDTDVMQPWNISTGSGADAPWVGINSAVADKLYGLRHGNIIRMSAQEFAGNPAGPATRPGWWTIKGMAQAMIVINRLANRNIVEMAYPEQIELP